MNKRQVAGVPPKMLNRDDAVQVMGIEGIFQVLARDTATVTVLLPGGATMKVNWRQVRRVEGKHAS